MKRALIRTATGDVVNVIELPDNWKSGAGKPGQYEPPPGHEVTYRPSAAPGDKLIAGKIVKAAPPAPPAKEEIFDKTTAAEPVLGALLEMIDDGTLVPGANVGTETLKTSVSDRMRAMEAAKNAE